MADALIITQEDINRAIAADRNVSNARCCPVWQAFHKLVPGLEITVGLWYVVIGNFPRSSVALPREAYPITALHRSKWVGLKPMEIPWLGLDEIVSRCNSIA